MPCVILKNISNWQQTVLKTIQNPLLVIVIISNLTAVEKTCSRSTFIEDTLQISGTGKSFQNTWALCESYSVHSYESFYPICPVGSSFGIAGLQVEVTQTQTEVKMSR